jgi:hypothetical protein
MAVTAFRHPGWGLITKNDLTLQIIPFASQMSYVLCLTLSGIQAGLDSFTQKTQKPQLSLRLYLWLSGRQDMNDIDFQLVMNLKIVKIALMVMIT